MIIMLWIWIILLKNCVCWTLFVCFRIVKDLIFRSRIECGALFALTTKTRTNNVWKMVVLFRFRSFLFWFWFHVNKFSHWITVILLAVDLDRWMRVPRTHPLAYTIPINRTNRDQQCEKKSHPKLIWFNFNDYIFARSFVRSFVIVGMRACVVRNR